MTRLFAQLAGLAVLAVGVLAEGLNIKVTHTPPDCSLKTQNGDMLAMHYDGTLKDGSPFDSSRQRNEPLEFKLGAGQVIKGWEEGLKDMCIGEKRILTIPHDMAYGERGFPPVIPPKATLVFDVELVDIKNRKKDKQEL